MVERSSTPIRQFNRFSFDPEALRLFKDDRPVKLKRQPLQVLALLTSKPGEVATRQEIRKCLWGDNTNVEYEQGINGCVKQLRRALGDKTVTPRFIETVKEPASGYRFLAEVEAVSATSVVTRALRKSSADSGRPDDARSGGRRRRFQIALPIVGLVATFVAWSWYAKISDAPQFLPLTDETRFTLAVASFENDDGDEYAKLVFERLDELFGAHGDNTVQIVRFGRTITRRGPEFAKALELAHEEARTLLAASGADVLVWGTVLTYRDAAVPKLYWTTSKDLALRKAWGQYDPTEDLELPSIFWNDFGRRSLFAGGHARR